MYHDIFITIHLLCQVNLAGGCVFQNYHKSAQGAYKPVTGGNTMIDVRATSYQQGIKQTAQFGGPYTLRLAFPPNDTSLTQTHRLTQQVVLASLLQLDQVSVDDLVDIPTGYLIELLASGGKQTNCENVAYTTGHLKVLQSDAATCSYNSAALVLATDSLYLQSQLDEATISKCSVGVAGKYKQEQTAVQFLSLCRELGTQIRGVLFDGIGDCFTQEVLNLLDFKTSTLGFKAVKRPHSFLLSRLIHHFTSVNVKDMVSKPGAPFAIANGSVAFCNGWQACFPNVGFLERHCLQGFQLTSAFTRESVVSPTAATLRPGWATSSSSSSSGAHQTGGNHWSAVASNYNNAVADSSFMFEPLSWAQDMDVRNFSISQQSSQQQVLSGGMVQRLTVCTTRDTSRSVLASAYGRRRVDSQISLFDLNASWNQPGFSLVSGEQWEVQLDADYLDKANTSF
jgi:hypothetical protein